MIRRGWILAAAVTAVGMTASSAAAVGPAAEALFEDGRRLLAEGNIAEACARFAESNAIEASSGTLLNLAHCHEKLGQTATAWAEYQAAARLAREQGREDRAAVADEKAVAIAGRLSKLTLVPAKVVPGLTVATETGALAEGTFDVGVPIDPGVHHVTARAPGHEAWTTIVEIAAQAQLTLTIPALTAMQPPKAAAPAPLPVTLVASRELPPPSPSRLDQYLATGGGVLLLGGVTVWTVAYTKFENAKIACTTGCTAEERSNRIVTIQALQGVAIGCGIAGAALLVASGVNHTLRKKRAPMMVALDPVNHGFSLLTDF